MNSTLQLCRAALAATLGCALLLAAPAWAQNDDIPRTPSGKPDFSGIWQAITSAHYDIEPHAARMGPHPGLFGAHSAIPASLGVIEGGRIPYNEQALRVRDANRANALENDPLTSVSCPACRVRTTCLSPSRSCNRRM